MLPHFIFIPPQTSLQSKFIGNAYSNKQHFLCPPPFCHQIPHQPLCHLNPPLPFPANNIGSVSTSLNLIDLELTVLGSPQIIDVFMQYPCSIHAEFIQYSCRIYSASISLCSIHALSMQYSCSIHAVFMQYSCSIHAFVVFMQYSCI